MYLNVLKIVKFLIQTQGLRYILGKDLRKKQ